MQHEGHTHCSQRPYSHKLDSNITTIGTRGLSRGLFHKLKIVQIRALCPEEPCAVSAYCWSMLAQCTHKTVFHQVRLALVRLTDWADQGNGT